MTAKEEQRQRGLLTEALIKGLQEAEDSEYHYYDTAICIVTTLDKAGFKITCK